MHIKNLALKPEAKFQIVFPSFLPPPPPPPTQAIKMPSEAIKTKQKCRLLRMRKSVHRVGEGGRGKRVEKEKSNESSGCYSKRSVYLKRLKEERDVKQGLKGQCHEKGMTFYRMRFCCPRTGFTCQNGVFAIYCNGISCVLISQIFLQHACHFGMHH